MTPRTWAEKKVAKAVTGYQWNARIRKSTVRLPAIAAKLLLAEHQRAVRIANKHRQECLALVSGETRRSAKNMLDGRIAALHSFLAALERGRTARRNK